MVAARQISSEGRQLLIERFEGCRLHAYYDPASKNGKPITIGFGHTGKDVYMGQRITKQYADLLLMKDCQKFERTLDKKLPMGLSSRLYDATGSLIFNCGGGILKGKLLQLIWDGPETYTMLRNSWLQYCHAGGKKMRGLLIRRTAECDYVPL